MQNVGLIDRTKSAFLIIDLQEKLMPVIDGKEELFANVNKLIKGANILNVSLIVTEQYSKGLGHTCSQIELQKGQLIIEKMCFSSMLSDELNQRLKNLDIQSLIIAGVEAHICVLKTSLDALAQGYGVHVVADAVSSRKQFDKEIALERIKQAGGYIVSTEMVLFQLMDFAGTEEFKQISRLIK